MEKTIALIPGDGIGPDVVAEAVNVLNAVAKKFGHSFTYKNVLLRKIQMYMISSELEQCIGRARLLRKDNTVYVFSDFPVEQAMIRFDDYLE